MNEKDTALLGVHLRRLLQYFLMPCSGAFVLTTSPEQAEVLLRVVT